MITDILNSDVNETFVFADTADFDLDGDNAVNLADEPIFVDETRVTDSGTTISGQVVAGTEDFATSVGFNSSDALAGARARIDSPYAEFDFSSVFSGFDFFSF